MVHSDRTKIVHIKIFDAMDSIKQVPWMHRCTRDREIPDISRKAVILWQNLFHKR